MLSSVSTRREHNEPQRKSKHEKTLGESLDLTFSPYSPSVISFLFLSFYKILAVLLTAEHLLKNA